jgi:hypothetical protein
MGLLIRDECSIFTLTDVNEKLGFNNGCQIPVHNLHQAGHIEPAPTTNAPLKMDGKWSGNSFLLGSSSITNHGGPFLVNFMAH